MKLSKFTIFFPDYPEKGEYLAFNTRTQAIIKINAELKGFLDRLPLDFESLSGKEKEILKTLEENGITVNKDVDEDMFLDHWFNQMKYADQKIKAFVLTTYDCNFACPYCFEEGVRKEIYLKDETADRITAWLAEKSREKRASEIKVIFYGGEPLMNIKAIERISIPLKKWSEKSGIEYKFSLVTNGALLTKKTVEKLKPLGLYAAKVTLDGTKEVHDKKRPFRSGAGSFDIIIMNMLETADLVDISVGSNFDDENYENLFELLDYLEEAGLKEKIKPIDMKPITDRIESIGNPETACVSYESEKLQDKMIALRKEIFRRGFNSPRSLGVDFCTLMASDSQVVIDPEGILYKCPSMVGRKEFSVGSIYEPLERNQRYLDFISMDNWKKCRDCVYVPMCVGGCAFSAYLRYGDYKKISCEKRLFEKALPEYIKMNYENELRAQTV